MLSKLVSFLFILFFAFSFSLSSFAQDGTDLGEDPGEGEENTGGDEAYKLLMLKCSNYMDIIEDRIF